MRAMSVTLAVPPRRPAHPALIHRSRRRSRGLGVLAPGGDASDLLHRLAPHHRLPRDLAQPPVALELRFVVPLIRGRLLREVGVEVAVLEDVDRGRLAAACSGEYAMTFADYLTRVWCTESERHVTLPSAMTPDPALDAEVRSLVDDYRERCLWFVRADYYPSTPDEILRVLRWIFARGDREAFQRAGKIEEWLSRTSSGKSAAS